MIAGDGGAYLGLLSFLSFGFSVIAAVLAIDMYTLLRTGELGKTWRVLIIASVMFALAQVMRMTEILNPRVANYGMSQIVELVFVLALAYAFFLQRRAFTHAAKLRGEDRKSKSHRTAPHKKDQQLEDGATPSNAGSPVTAYSEEMPVPAHDDDPLAPLENDDAEIEWSHKSPRKRRRSPAPPSLLSNGK